MPIASHVETSPEGEKLRVYHERSAPVDPRTPVEKRGGVTHSWTHPYEDRETCEACTEGKMPASVRRGESS